MTIIYTSCGFGELSNGKAEHILEDCLEDDPLERYHVLKAGILTFLKNTKASRKEYKPKDHEDPLDAWRREAELRRELRVIENSGIEMMGFYNHLKEEGVISFELLDESPSDFFETTEMKYEVRLTKKGLRYIKNEERSDNNFRVLLYRYVVDEVKEVQEIPAMNTAKVQVVYKPTDFSPFYVSLEEEGDLSMEKTLDFRKTSNGWVYCD